MSENNEAKIPVKWLEKLEFAKQVWEWWPDKTNLQGFVDFLALIFTYS